MEPAQPRRFLFTQAGGQEILSPAGCVGFAFLLVVNHGVIRVHNIIGALVPAAAGCSAGLLAAQTDGTVGVLVEVNSETDFGAKNQKFIDFARSVLEAAVASGASDVDSLLAAPMGDSTVKEQLDAMAASIVFSNAG